MFRKITNGSVALVQKYLPDAFIFALILTIIVGVAAIFVTNQSIFDIVNHWGNGVWSLLAFSMQMALVLVLGSALASSLPVKKGLSKIASFAKTPSQAVLLVTFVSGVAYWFNWGFGLIVGVLLAKEVAKNVKNVDYRVLVASGYAPFAIWHAGLSGSIPLIIGSNKEEIALVTQGAINEIIPVSRTIFALPNLIAVMVLIITLPLLFKAMHPKNGEKIVSIDGNLLNDTDLVELEQSKESLTPAEKLENSRILSLVIVVMGIIYLFNHFSNKGFDLSLNIVNLIFLLLGILFHQTPINYVKAINSGIIGAAGILLQFPFYAGIMGIMIGANAQGISLASTITNAFVSIANAYNLPILTFLSAGLVNVFVPSGGGQWAVQGPIIMPAAVELGADPAVTAMAIAWGDAWTNLIQPFWALPALGIAKLGARDIMGYCMTALFYVGTVIILTLLIWSFVV